MTKAADPRKGWYLGLSSRGFHRLAYHEWGARDAPRTLVCVHGLSRNGRDFVELAEAAAARGWRVICPDVAGRGDSEPLPDPADYGFPQYLQDMNALLARLDVERVDWVGTSMGGIIGMMLAARRGHPIGRMVLNDIGPFLPKAALEQVAAKASEQPRWPDRAAAERDLRRIYAGFGPLDEPQWQLLFDRSLRPAPDGGLERNYDPAIARAFAAGPIEDVDIWSFWDRLDLPVLVVRGAESELLPAAVAEEMTRRGPQAALVELPDYGHAPALMKPEETARLLDWLEEKD